MSTKIDQRSSVNAETKKLLKEIKKFKKYRRKFKKLLGEREELIERKAWLKKHRNTPKNREEWLKKTSEFQKQLKKYRAELKSWLNANIAFKKAHRKTELSLLRPTESPAAQLAAEIKEGRIWSIPEFLSSVENTIQDAVLTSSAPAIAPTTFEMWSTINTAMREKCEKRKINHSLSWIAERAEFFNRVESHIEFFEKGRMGKDGLWEEVAAECGVPDTLSKTSIYAREAIIYLAENPQNNWINRLFRKLEKKHQDRVKELVAEGLSPVKSEFIEQLGTEKKSIPGKPLLKGIIEEKVVREIREIANLRIDPSTGEIY